MAWCDYHPDSTAVGMCMRCEARICTACCTRLEGINHCHRCLNELGKRSTKKRDASSAFNSLVLIGLLGALFWLILRLAQGSLF